MDGHPAAYFPYAVMERFKPKRMSKTKNKSNEWEFQGQVLAWLQAEINLRAGMKLEKVTQEPSKITPKRSDLIVWRNRSTEDAFLTFELKTPTTPLEDPKLFADAVFKAGRWKSPYFAIWNMRGAELYRRSEDGVTTPDNRLGDVLLLPEIKSVDDWLQPQRAVDLQRVALKLLDGAWADWANNSSVLIEIEASVFVDKLSGQLERLKIYFTSSLTKKAATSKKVRNRLKEMAAEQGFISFVGNIDAAIAGQYAYRLVGQILFYFSLRRRQASLKPLKIGLKDQLPAAFKPFWNDVRRFDYEALFEWSELDDLIPVGSDAALVLISLVDSLPAPISSWPIWTTSCVRNGSLATLW
jgi:hypothetical protein